MDVIILESCDSTWIFHAELKQKDLGSQVNSEVTNL